MTDWPLDQILTLAGALLAAGAGAGLLAGLLGVGGGIVVVPVLYYLFTGLGIDADVRMHTAVGTSLATIIATSLSSARSHARKGAVDFAVLRSWGPWVLAGVVIGSALAGMLRGPTLTAIFAAISLMVATHMAFGRAHWRLGQSLPTGATKAAIAGAIGCVSSMMGIGGGSLSVPAMTLFGYPIHRAVGTAAAIGLLIGVPGAVGFAVSGWAVAGRPPFSLGYINLLGVALILPTSTLVAPWGARLAHALETAKLRRAFALFLGLTAARMLWGLLG